MTATDHRTAPVGPGLDFGIWRKHGVPDTAHIVGDVLGRYRSRVIRADVAIVVIVTGLASTARFGFTDARLANTSGVPHAPYWAVVAATSAIWMLCLVLYGCWSKGLPVEGPLEFRRLLAASTSVLTATVTVDYVLQLEIARGFLLLALPAAVLFMAVARLFSRRLLRRRWRRGLDVTKILVVGGPVSAVLLADQFRRARHRGYTVSGLCVPGGSPTDLEAMGAEDAPDACLAGIPVVGGLGDIVQAITSCQASVVAIAPTDGFGSREVRDLSWSLEGTGIRMVLAPAIADVAQPRLRLRPIGGLPLMHVEEVSLRGPKLFIKNLMDVVLSFVGLVLLSPLMVAIALAIKFDDSGPVFFPQERVGLGGRSFRMWKFRSMVVDAESQMDDLMSSSDGNGVLFKLKVDPRITRVGRFLRKTSLDELPQLFNVLTGSMSLVGPRPPLLREVELYASEVYRKLMVKPGMTGLWQVSGRSELEWDESVRLDLYYVENWSFVSDVIILMQTIRVMVSKSGAY